MTIGRWLLQFCFGTSQELWDNIRLQQRKQTQVTLSRSAWLRSMKILMSPDSLSFYQLISYTHFELRTEGLSMVRCSCLCVFTRSTLPSPATESLLPNLRGFQCRRFPGCLKKWDGVYSGCKEVTCDTWFPHKSGAVLWELGQLFYHFLWFLWFKLLLGGGFKHFLCSSLFGGNDPNWLIFLRWVETTN